MFKYLIERKKDLDLADSIISKRIDEQKSRMDLILFQKILIFEGSTNNTNLSQEQLEHKIASMMVRDQFKVFYSNDVNGTVDILNSMYRSVYQKLNSILSGKSDEMVLNILKENSEMILLREFNDIFKKTKNNNVGSVMSKMLNCINKMSSGKSELLANH